MLRILLAVAIYVVLPTSDADACSCVQRTFADHAKAEKRVFLARAGKPLKTGDRLEQTWTILATFKGPVEAQFKHVRSRTPPCASNYADGEFAILFTTAGDLDPCHGNELLESQAPQLGGIFDATATKYGPAKQDAIEAALRKVLPKYLHARPEVSVRHAALDGKSFTIDKSKLTFAKAAAPKDIEITKAIGSATLDSVALVEGRYASEGLRFTVLLHLDKTWNVVGSWVVEN